MPLYDFECERCHTRTEKLVKMDVKTYPCLQAGCGGTTKRDEVPQIRRLNNDPNANASSLRFQFNWMPY